jgi:DNA-binding MarR family transcriptional regulator
MVTESSIQEFEQCVIQLERLLRTVSSIIKRRGRDVLQDFDITTPQFNALLILRHRNLTIGELGERMFLACSTATDLIDRMERNNLVERVRDSNDRRVIRLNVTERGMQMVDEVMTARIRYLSKILQDVSLEELKVMIAGMTHLEELMRDSQVTSSRA